MGIKLITVAALALGGLSQSAFANTRYVCVGKELRVTVYNSTDFFKKEKFILLIANRLRDSDSTMGNLLGPIVLKMENGDKVETVNQLPSIEKFSGFEIWDKSFEFNVRASSFVIKRGSQVIFRDNKMICNFD